MNIKVVSQMMPALVTIIFVKKYSLTEIFYYYRQYDVTNKNTDRKIQLLYWAKIQLLYWAESWGEKLEAPPTLTLQKSSRISRKNSFFLFTLHQKQLRNISAVKVQHISPCKQTRNLSKKITSPRFWNARIPIFSEKFRQPGKNPGIDGPKEFHAEQALIFV